MRSATGFQLLRERIGVGCFLRRGDERNEVQHRNECAPASSGNAAALRAFPHDVWGRPDERLGSANLRSSYRVHRCSPQVHFMSDDKIIPFKPRPRVISEQELDAFRLATRNWHPMMREMMFPEHAKQERDREQE